jgi:hypothetical protein
MSLFQLYETERKHFAVGKKWICVNPRSIGFPGVAQGEIIEVIENKGIISRYKVLSGRYEGAEYQSHKSDIKSAYELYTEP